MKKAKNKSDNKGPVIIRVDKELDSYVKKDLFKEKVEKMKEILRTTRLPKFED